MNELLQINKLGIYAAWRADRLLTRYFFRFCANRISRKGFRLPILMYHSICDEPETGHPYYWINTSRALFADQMRYLYDSQYQVISLSEAVGLINRNNQCHASCSKSAVPRRKVVLTFDDGYLDFYTEALPLLKRYDFSATVFLPTAFINGSRDGLRGKEHLSWDLVRKLQGEVVSFGSHTVTHPQMFELTINGIEDEVNSSKNEIEDKIGKNVESFCYPYKFPEQDRRFISILQEILQKTGYKSGVCTSIGTLHSHGDIFYLKRIPVNSGDDIPFFRAKLDGGYDWMSTIQLFSKKVNKLRTSSR